MFKKRLNELKPGESGKISSVSAKGSGRQRMLDMGLVKGAEIKMVRKAPFGDPMEFEVKGYNLSLRKAEAADVEVEVA